MFCGQYTACKYADGALDASRLYCRSWRCEECLPRRLRELRKLTASGNPTALITLTWNPEQQATSDEAAKQLVHAWRMIRQRAKRDGIADRIEYIAIFEHTKKGWPHLHILARAPYIPQAWLSARMKEYAGSPIVDIRRVYSKRHASRYVAKYVSKGPAQYVGTKRYFRSQQYSTEGRDHAPVHDANKPGWISDTDVQILRYEIEQRGWRIVEESERWWRAQPGADALWIGPRDPPGNGWPELGHWWRQSCDW